MKKGMFQIKMMEQRKLNGVMMTSKILKKKKKKRQNNVFFYCNSWTRSDIRRFRNFYTRAKKFYEPRSGFAMHSKESC